MSSQINPYLPPSSELGVAPPGAGAVPASRGRRFGTFVVDYLVFLAVAFCFGAFVVLACGDAGLVWLQSVPDILLGVGITGAYYVFFEGIWTRTPGKWLFGTVVISEDGGKPGIGQVLGRTACRFIPFEVFSTFTGRPWHDRLPKTRVVMARAA